MGGDWLDRIIPAKHAEIEETRRNMPQAQLEDRIANSPVPDSLPGSILQSPPGIIAEIKRRSPSAGELRRDAGRTGLLELARAYRRGGAAAISVLTEKQFFGGSWEDLEAVRSAVDLPVLMKDFIVDEYQVFLGRAMGASSVLLIAKVLDDIRLKQFISLSRQLEMEPLVEVHSRGELARAAAAGSVLIGINNRNLGTLHTDLQVTYNLVSDVPRGSLVVSESGIRSREDVKGLWARGVRGFLIGEALLRHPHPEAKLREFTEAVVGEG